MEAFPGHPRRRPSWRSTVPLGLRLAPSTLLYTKSFTSASINTCACRQLHLCHFTCNYTLTCTAPPALHTHPLARCLSCSRPFLRCPSTLPPLPPHLAPSRSQSRQLHAHPRSAVTPELPFVHLPSVSSEPCLPHSPSLTAPAAPRPPARPRAATCSACPPAPPSTPRPPPPAGAWA